MSAVRSVRIKDLHGARIKPVPARICEADMLPYLVRHGLESAGRMTASRTPCRKAHSSSTWLSTLVMVDRDGLRQAARFGQPFSTTSSADRQRCVDFDRQARARVVIDHGQARMRRSLAKPSATKSIDQLWFAAVGLGSDRRDVDDASRAPRNHRCSFHRLRQQKNAAHVQVRDLVPRFKRMIFSRRAPACTGVVHQDVDFTEVRTCVCGKARDVFGVEQAAIPVGADALLAQFRTRLPQFFSPACG